ncbi:hypothetical protein NMY22_g5156 [Coprinellus aureogranulatus]|nr:hypothetical protein NMY22_g5156 [Coprinellus aureogranulatus]
MPLLACPYPNYPSINASLERQTADMPSNTKSAAHRTSATREHRGRSALLDSLYIDYDKDGREADARFADIEPGVLADLERAASSKRKRTLSAKAKAALERSGYSSDELDEHIKAKKPNSRPGKRADASPTYDDEPGIRPPDSHPASLVRLRSPATLQRRTPPPKFKRKYKSYSDAVSGSASSEDDAMSIEGESEARVERQKDDEAGSLANFIDDRAEDQLSVYSDGYPEEPPRKRSKESEKLNDRRPRSSDRRRESNRRDRSHGVQRRNGAKGSRATDPLVVSDDEDGNSHGRGKASRKHSSLGNRPNDPILVSDDESQDERTAGKEVSIKRGSAQRNRYSSVTYLRGSNKVTDSNGYSVERNKGLGSARQKNHRDRSMAEVRSTADDRHSGTRRRAPTNANLSDASSEPIDWPTTPEDSPRNRPSGKSLDVEARARRRVSALEFDVLRSFRAVFTQGRDAILTTMNDSRTLRRRDLLVYRRVKDVGGTRRLGVRAILGLGSTFRLCHVPVVRRVSSPTLQFPPFFNSRSTLQSPLHPPPFLPLSRSLAFFVDRNLY